MKWIKFEEKEPPNNKKILLFKDGDIWVGGYLPEGKYISFGNKNFEKLEPEYWCEIENLPDNYTGKIYTHIGYFKEL